MAKIRQFTPRKEKKEEIPFSDRIRRYRRGQALKLLIIIVLIVGVAGVVYYRWKNSSYSSYVELLSTPKVTASGSTHENHNGNVLTYSKDGISSMDAKGNIVWNETYQMQNPMVKVNGGIVAAGDYNGHIIYIMDESGKMGEVDTNLPIRDMAVSKDGIVAVVLEDNELMRIHVYDPQGTELVKSECRMQQNGYPVAIALSDDGTVMGVSYLYVDSGTIKSTVAFYNFSGVGQSSIDRLVSSWEYPDTIIPYLGFFGKEEVFAVGNGRISFFGGEEKPVSTADRLLNEEIRSVYTGEDHIGLLYLDTTGAALYRLDVYDSSGQLILSQSIDMEFQDILIGKNDLLVYDETTCVMYGLNGTEKYRGTFGKNVNRIIPAGKSNKFLLITSNSIDTIELR